MPLVLFLQDITTEELSACWRAGGMAFPFSPFRVGRNLGLRLEIASEHQFVSRKSCNRWLCSSQIHYLHTSPTESIPTCKMLLLGEFLNMQSRQVFSGFYKCQHPFGFIEDNFPWLSLAKVSVVF
jgi:hypothetical protein